MSPTQVAYARSMLPRIEARAAYPVATAIAQALNMLGGKRPPKRKSKEKPLQPHELFTPLEFLPPFAWFSDPVIISENAVSLWQEHVNELPVWVVESFEQQFRS